MYDDDDDYNDYDFSELLYELEKTGEILREFEKENNKDITIKNEHDV